VLVIAEGDHPIGLGLGEEDAPAILRHPHVTELGPALGVDADRGAQVDLAGLQALGPHVPPPVQELWLPLLERPQEPAVPGEVDMPVSASGENAARSSMARRTSSSQSMSSGIKVTSPASSAAGASRSWPRRPFRSSTRPGSARKRLARRVRPLAIG